MLLKGKVVLSTGSVVRVSDWHLVGKGIRVFNFGDVLFSLIVISS